eukprot:TRINITY_DN2543_c0_g1_i6.p1 TRINITY_DN2543_c0_g1~~TRINITY_DN2543_c0_g1_i6.p1  ORF type:complete len:115 (-),score=18.50 TRINITY_DN2543_c0_g1_i6:1428-1733(-)
MSSISSVIRSAAAQSASLAALGSAIVGGLAMAYFSPSSADSLRVGFRNASTLTEIDAKSEELGRDCDCAPLWECMQAGNRNCAHLARKLDDCLRRAKDRQM